MTENMFPKSFPFGDGTSSADGGTNDIWYNDSLSNQDEVLEVRAQLKHERYMHQHEVEEIMQQKDQVELELSVMNIELKRKDSIKDYAALLVKETGCSCCADLDRQLPQLQAQLCQNMHQMRIFEDRLSIVKKSSNAVIASLNEEILKLMDEQSEMEITLLNDIAAMRHDMSRMSRKYDGNKLQTQNDTILAQSIREDDQNDVGFSTSEEAQKRLSNAFYESQRRTDEEAKRYEEMIIRRRGESLRLKGLFCWSKKGRYGNAPNSNANLLGAEQNIEASNIVSLRTDESGTEQNQKTFYGFEEHNSLSPTPLTSYNDPAESISSKSHGVDPVSTIGYVQLAIGDKASTAMGNVKLVVDDRRSTTTTEYQVDTTEYPVLSALLKQLGDAKAKNDEMSICIRQLTERNDALVREKATLAAKIKKMTTEKVVLLQRQKSSRSSERRLEGMVRKRYISSASHMAYVTLADEQEAGNENSTKASKKKEIKQDDDMRRSISHVNRSSGLGSIGSLSSIQTRTQRTVNSTKKLKLYEEQVEKLRTLSQEQRDLISSCGLILAKLEKADSKPNAEIRSDTTLKTRNRIPEKSQICAMKALVRAVIAQSQKIKEQKMKLALTSHQRERLQR